MAYSSEISRDNPVAFVFLIDQSYSMNDQSSGQDENGNPLSMAEAVADAINAILEELTNVAQRDDGVRDYFEIALIGYGGNETFLWEGNLKGQCFAKISDIKENADVETTTTEVMVRGKLMEEEHTKLSWLKPKAINNTPMKGTFEIAEKELRKWVANHKKSYPPIVINITDGMANDVTDPIELINASKNLQNISTDDGNTIVINIHISNGGHTVIFPNDISQVNGYGTILFEMSSILPENFVNSAKEIFRLTETDNIRGIAVNASMVDLVKILDIGTRPAKDAGIQI
jgi:hypothetical protein